MSRSKTDYIVLHCAATPPTMDIGKKEIDRWHRAQGWLKIGYHFVIRRNGQVETGRSLYESGAHVNPPSGINSSSIGICMVGGVDKDRKPSNNFTAEQWFALDKLVTEMQAKFPDAKIVGHGELSKDRACPSFNVQEWVRKRSSNYGQPTRDRPVLMRGSGGEAVKEMQRLLKTVKATGQFGPTTEEKVKEFQKKHGLMFDGICGPKTWGVLLSGQ